MEVRITKRPRLVSLYRYNEGEGRKLAHGVKDGDIKSIETAGKRMRLIIPKGSVLIPIPNRCGYAKTTLALCESIAKNGNYVVYDCLACDVRERSLHELKMDGKGIKSINLGMRLKQGTNIVNKNVCYLIDNCFDSGKTYDAASEVSGVFNFATIGTVDTTRVKVAFGFVAKGGMI